MAYELNSIVLKGSRIILKGRQFDGIEREYLRMEISHPDSAEQFGHELIAAAKLWRASDRQHKMETIDNLRKQRLQLDAQIKKLTKEYDQEQESLGQKAT